MDIDNTALILGRLWRCQNEILVNSADDRWLYGSGSPAFEVREAWQFVRDIEDADEVFAISVRSIAAAEG
jgi:hypothetical protein